MFHVIEIHCKFPMKTTKKRFTGNLGEALAAKYLKNKGFLVIGRNYLLSYGEVDLVVQRGGVIHFVEVKSVTCEIPQEGVPHEMLRADWNPAERLDTRKLAKVGKAAQTFLAERGLLDRDWQIDGVLVYIDATTKRAKVEWFENIGTEN